MFELIRKANSLLGIFITSFICFRIKYNANGSGAAMSQAFRMSKIGYELARMNRDIKYKR